MAEKAEIRAELKMDDHASSVLESVKGSAEHLGEKVHEVQHELMGMAKQAVATAVGFQFDRGIESVKELAGETIKAAMAAGSQKKEIAQVLAMADREGRSFMELRGEASKLHEELEDMAIATGTSSEAVISSFNDIALRSGKGTDEVVKFTEQMLQAGRVVPGGINAISSGFEMMQMGIVRARNPIVQLISATHTLEGNAKSVAAQMMKMTPEKQLALGEKAISAMAEKAKTMPLGFGSIVESMKAVREQLFAAVGAPMMGVLGKELGKLRTYLLANKEAMQGYAKAIGEKAGEWIHEGAEALRSAMTYLKEHGDEIRKALTEAANAIKEAFKFAVDHKDELMLAAKIYAGGKVAGAVGGMVSPIASGVTSLAAKGGFGLAAGGAGVMASAAALAAFSAAIIGVGAAAYQGKKLYEENFKKSSSEKDIDAYVERMNELAKQGQTKQIEEMGKGAAGKVRKDAGIFEDADALEAKMATYTQLYADISKGVVQATQEIMAASDEGAANMNTQSMVDAYNRAVVSHNDAAQKYAAGVLFANGDLMKVLEDSGAMLAGGLEAFGAQLSDSARSTLEELKASGATGKHKQEKPPAATTNFNGGQSFQIKQDFRNEDPDRIAAIFRKDILRAAESRRQSRVGTPFGA